MPLITESLLLSFQHAMWFPRKTKRPNLYQMRLTRNPSEIERVYLETVTLPVRPRDPSSTFHRHSGPQN